MEILETSSKTPPSPRWQLNPSLRFPGAKGWEALFCDSSEFHMGAYAWDLKLLRDGKEVTPVRLKMKKMLEGGFLCPESYQPWSHDSERLLLATWKGGAFLYDPVRASSTKCHLDGTLVSAKGSKKFPRFLTVTVNRSYLVGLDGSAQEISGVRVSLHQYPDFHWWGGQFFTIESLGEGKSQLRFFDLESAVPPVSIPFHPSEVFPYDEARYRSLSRDSYALVLSNSTQCVASLMDEWSYISFDEEAGVLQMRVYRPVSEVFTLRGHDVCRVEERWVKARIHS